MMPRASPSALQRDAPCTRGAQLAAARVNLSTHAGNVGEKQWLWALLVRSHTLHRAPMYTAFLPCVVSMGTVRRPPVLLCCAVHQMRN